MIASVSSAAGDRRRGRSANCARSMVSAYSRRVRNCHPSAISTSSTPCSSPYAELVEIAEGWQFHQLDAVLIAVRRPKGGEGGTDSSFAGLGLERRQLVERQRARRREQRGFKQLRERLHA